MLPVGEKLVLIGSNSSAESSNVVSLNPPATRTFPLLSNVAVCNSRGVFMLPAEMNCETVTWIEFEVPVIEARTVSVAVMVWLPTVFSVAGKVPVPFVSVVLAGRTAWLSVLEKCTVPE